LVFAQTVSVQGRFLEPPVESAGERFIDLIQELRVGMLAVQFPGGPGGQMEAC